jgi:hypothetical protein
MIAHGIDLVRAENRRDPFLADKLLFFILGVNSVCYAKIRVKAEVAHIFFAILVPITPCNFCLLKDSKALWEGSRKKRSGVKKAKPLLLARGFALCGACLLAESYP